MWVLEAQGIVGMSFMDDFLAKYAATMTPPAARFLLENAMFHKKQFSDEIMAVLKAIAESGQPKSEAPK